MLSVFSVTKKYTALIARNQEQIERNSARFARDCARLRGRKRDLTVDFDEDILSKTQVIQSRYLLYLST